MRRSRRGSARFILQVLDRSEQTERGARLASRRRAVARTEVAPSNAYLRSEHTERAKRATSESNLGETSGCEDRVITS